MDSTASRVEKPRIGIFGIGLQAYVTRWSEEGPTHHCALGIGDQAEVLLKVGHLLDVPSIRV